MNKHTESVPQAKGQGKLAEQVLDCLTAVTIALALLGLVVVEFNLY